MEETWESLLQEVETAEHALATVRQRLMEVMDGEQEQAELYQQQTELQAQLQTTHGNTEKEMLRQRLQEITDRLGEIEVNLESRLFSWSSLREVFWQAVRFMGLGVVLGALLQRCAGC